METSEGEVVNKHHAGNSQAGLLRVLCMMLFACGVMLAISVVGLIDRRKEIESLQARGAALRAELDAKRGRAIELRDIGDDTYIVVGVLGNPSNEDIANEYIVVRNLKTITQIDGDGEKVRDDVLIKARRLSTRIKQGFICTNAGCARPTDGKSLADYLS